jgi:hypothetical protein
MLTMMMTMMALMMMTRGPPAATTGGLAGLTSSSQAPATTTHSQEGTTGPLAVTHSSPEQPCQSLIIVMPHTTASGPSQSPKRPL